MMSGSVQPNFDAVVTLLLRGPDGTSVDVQALVDTGFNGSLTLSTEIVQSLNLPFRERVQYVLADGTESESRLFIAEIKWFGRWRRIPVAEMDGDPLFGMAAMQGSFLGIEIVDGGRVEIRRLGP